MNPISLAVNSTLSKIREVQSEAIAILKGARQTKYRYKLATGNPKRPWRYFYTEIEYKKALEELHSKRIQPKQQAPFTLTQDEPPKAKVSGVSSEPNLFGITPRNEGKFTHSNYLPSFKIKTEIKNVADLITAIKNCLMDEGLDGKAKEWIDLTYRTEIKSRDVLNLAYKYVLINSEQSNAINKGLVKGAVEQKQGELFAEKKSDEPNMLLKLPEGFSSSGPNSMAISNDPLTGALIDKQIATGKWFVLPNDPNLKEGFKDILFNSRDEAFSFLSKEISANKEKEILNPNARSLAMMGNDNAAGTRNILMDSERSFETGKFNLERLFQSFSDIENAMYRREIGFIDFRLGDNPGTPEKGYHDGGGIRHIVLARHSEGKSIPQIVSHLEKIVEGIAKGTFQEQSLSPTKQRKILTYDNLKILLVKEASGNWLLTGYELKSDEGGKESDILSSTQETAIPSHGYLGADFVTRIIEEARLVNQEKKEALNGRTDSAQQSERLTTPSNSLDLDITKSEESQEIFPENKTPVQVSVEETKKELQKAMLESEVKLKNAFDVGSKVLFEGEEKEITQVRLENGILFYHYKSLFDDETGFAPASEFKSIPVKDPAKIQETIKNTTPETRKKAEQTLFGQESTEAESEKSLFETAISYDYEPKQTSISLGGISGIALDYSDTPEDGLMAWDHKKNPDLHTLKQPPWFPETMDLAGAKFYGFRLLKFPLDQNNLSGKYAVKAMANGESYLYVLTAKQILCIEKYYQEAQKSNYKAKGISRRIQVYKGSKMSNSQAILMKQGLEIRGYRSEEQKVMWNLHNRMEEAFDYSSDDYELRFKDRVDSNTYHKGQETSYGDSGTVSNLYDSLGVKVKMQNGTDVSPRALKEVEYGLKEVYSVFGDRSEMARKFGLKISHAGKTLQHARKALGIYFPSFNAIGTNFIGHEENPNLTLAHEFAHFMDNYIGMQESGRKFAFASERGIGIESEIARVFRDGMAKDVKAKPYWRRSCECFARAMECYFLTKTNSPYIGRNGANPDEEYFESKVAPLIEKFFQEKNEILKSFLGQRIKTVVVQKKRELRKIA